MSLDNKPIYAGGCQCGRVRFRVEGAPARASICHCRMCQKAFGALFAPLVSVAPETLTWTRGTPRHFQSSNHVRRGFCEACGTPLTYEAPDGLALALGAFDDPAALAPTVQFGTEAKIGYVDSLAALPGRDTLADAAESPFLGSVVSYQHPDHDTDTWPAPAP